MKNNLDELQVLMVHANRGQMDIPSLLKPWLLRDEEANKYWQRVYERWMERKVKQKAGIQMELESEISPEMQCLIEEDEQFWSYKDVVPNEEGELPRWNKRGPRKMAIFDWLPWGAPGSYREVEVLSAQLLNHRDELVWRLSEP